MEGLRLVLDGRLLTELELGGGKYTWEKCRSKKEWVRERLVRAFGTTSWWSKFPLCKLKVHHTSCSDHDPIKVYLLNTSISKKIFRFKFENTWLKDPSFHKEVVEF